jgi:hypothetical protein
MNKKLLGLIFCAVAASTALEARHWRHGGWGRGGWGWGGYGPSFGVTVPIGGNGGPKMPAAAQQFKRQKGYYPNSAQDFCNWAKGYFTKEKAQEVCNEYENYLSAPRYRSQPSGAISFGVGGGYGPYYGGYPYGYGYPFGIGGGYPYGPFW